MSEKKIIQSRNEQLMSCRLAAEKVSEWWTERLLNVTDEEKQIFKKSLETLAEAELITKMHYLIGCVFKSDSMNFLLQNFENDSTNNRVNVVEISRKIAEISQENIPMTYMHVTFNQETAEIEKIQIINPTSTSFETIYRAK